MISPTVGRVVWFHRFTKDEPPEAAIVTFVHSDSLVNLAVFNSNGGVIGFTGVALWQGEGEAPAGEYAEWMPYQKAVAAGTTATVQHAAPPPPVLVPSTPLAPTPGAAPSVA
jgi:hypothetical protein